MLGFTVIELLVVIGIISLLISILLPVLSRARQAGRRTVIKAQMLTISTALSNYKDEFGDYPRRPGPGSDGSDLLVRTLIAPFDKAVDGADGAGFRVRKVGGVPQGPVKGPLIPLEKFRLKIDLAAPANPCQLLDNLGQPILYIPARPRTVATTGDYAAGTDAALYDTRYASEGFSTPATVKQLQFLLGDRNQNGQIDGNERPETTEPFILWSAGSDGLFGTSDLTSRGATRCDDVNNYN